MGPFFSIIIPTYNRGHFIEKTIESVLKQTYSSFEIIMVDDGSTDDTAEIAAKITDERFFYYQTENRERGAARNFGIKKARGNYINFLDSDDLFLPHHLLAAFEYLDKKDIVFLFQAYKIVNENHETLKNVTFKSNNVLVKNLCFSNALCPIGAFVRRDILLNHLFDEDRNFILAEDLFVWLKIGCRYPIHISNVITSCLVQHHNRSMTLPSEAVINYSLNKLISLLEKDECFSSKYKSLIPVVKANHYSLIALTCAISNERIKSLRYFIKALCFHKKEILKKRSLAIFKHLITFW